MACIKEGLRLNPPATNLFARVVPDGGKVVDGHYIPGGTEVTSYAYVMQRDGELYGADADEYRPGRWMEGEERTRELEGYQFSFGMGPRVCVGRDVAWMELGKVLPEVSCAAFVSPLFSWFLHFLFLLLRGRVERVRLLIVEQIVRRFDVEVVEKGEYVVAGGVAYNQGFSGRFVERK